jgi:hypothetical protein
MVRGLSLILNINNLLLELGVKTHGISGSKRLTNISLTLSGQDVFCPALLTTT